MRRTSSPKISVLLWQVLLLSGFFISGCDKLVKEWVGPKNGAVTEKPTEAPTPTPPVTFALGQPDEFTNRHLKLGGSWNMGTAVVGTKLIVVEYANHRVLIWNSIPTANQQPPDVVLGQPDFSTNISNNGGVSAKSLSSPVWVASDGTRLFVADGWGNNRVLIWNSIPTVNQQAADVVLGQPNMTSNTANNGGISAQSLARPYGIYTDGTRLFVAEETNNRVLIWNSIPTVNQQAADIVLGQPNMTSGTANNGGLTAQALSAPRGIGGSGTKFFATDLNNNRVLIWNSIPTVNQQAADIVLGQPNMTSNTANNGGVSAQSSYAPLGVHSNGTKFFILEGWYGNHRALVWNSIPTVNQQATDFVLGQPNMTSNTANNGGLGAQSLNGPFGGIYTSGNKLFISDTLNHRTLIWNSIPTVNQQAADVVLSQPNMTSNTANFSGVDNKTFRGSVGPTVNGQRLFVPDSLNNRVLIYNTLPTFSGAEANVVLGQPDFISSTANNGGISAATLNSPQRMFSIGNYLMVPDYLNHRILIWNSIPTANQQPANIVLGQPNMTSNTANNGGISAQSINAAVGVSGDGVRLFVSDYSNNRVLIWNSMPTFNQQPADLVVGQPNMTSNTANNGGIGAATLNAPTYAHSNGTYFAVTDYSNHRVLIWNSIPTANQQAANIVLGQPDMVSNTLNNGGLSNKSLANPDGLFFSGTKLYVVDRGNNRVLIWNAVPTGNFQPADAVVGQPDFVSNLANNGGVNGNSFNVPVGLSVSGGKMYIGDYSNSRILVTPSP